MELKLIIDILLLIVFFIFAVFCFASYHYEYIKVNELTNGKFEMYHIKNYLKKEYLATMNTEKECIRFVEKSFEEKIPIHIEYVHK